MLQFSVRICSLVTALFFAASANASLSEKCPASMVVTATGVQRSVSDAQFRLDLFDSQSPDLESIACMSAPGACVKCFYHDNQLPLDNSRIHTLNYRPAVTYAIDGVVIHDPEVAWFNTVILNHAGQFGLGIYLDSFTNTSVQIKAGQAPYLLQTTRLVDPTCEPTVMGDVVFPCETVTETVGSIQDIQMR